jgi:ArsR family transcriptional regulator
MKMVFLILALGMGAKNLTERVGIWGENMEFEVVGMEKKLYEMQAELCKTLSNPKRLEILDILKEREEISVNSLAEMLEIPKANTSQHLAVLRQAGVVNTRKDGINVYYSLKSAKISEACSLTRQILLERLEDHVSLSDLIRKTGD